jgi:hypothetical protein
LPNKNDNHSRLSTPNKRVEPNVFRVIAVLNDSTKSNKLSFV